VPIIQFKGKTAVENYHHVVPHHTLEMDEKLSTVKKPSLDGNLIVEGDNLIALKSLLPTHAGRIKCIYIDPPYNTGNEGWIYNDNLTQPQFKEWIGRVVGKEGEDATRHDKWCCMMYPRLQLLKELLRDDGAIFVSIDDNEVHHLRMLMDEIFGAENFVAAITWQKRTSPDARLVFSDAHEYIVCFAKNKEHLVFNKVPLSEEQRATFKNPDNDPRGPWVSSDYTAQGFRPNQMYSITTPSGRKVKPPAGTCWKNIEEVFIKLVSDNRIWFGKGGDGIPRRKTFLSESEGISPWTWWANDEVGHTQEAKKEITDIFQNEEAFATPKPVRLLKRIIQLSSESEDLTLDSFAGSGTTAHAVLDLNKEDGGNRKFILVQQPFDTKENAEQQFNICEKITRERVLRVSKGYSYKNGNGKTNKVEGLGGEFSYMRVGDKLMGEYRDLGGKLPSYEEIARYIYFTETSQNFDAKKINKTTGKIGEWKETSYYLLYTPNQKEDRAMDMEFLKNLKDKNPRKVIYCEKVWVHREDLYQFGEIRPMLVPFNLK
jgi:adenine-specific DNA-methyltransferase